MNKKLVIVNCWLFVYSVLLSQSVIAEENDRIYNGLIYNDVLLTNSMSNVQTIVREVFNKKYSPHAVTRLFLTNKLGGETYIRSHDGNSIQVIVELEDYIPNLADHIPGRKINIPEPYIKNNTLIIDQTAKNWEPVVVGEGNFRVIVRPSINYIIKIPENYEFKEYKVNGGSITIIHSAPIMKLETSSGSIYVEIMSYLNKGLVNVLSRSGSITCKMSAPFDGVLDAYTAAGSIEASVKSLLSPGRVKLQTDAGSIKIITAPTFEGVIDAYTMTGSIKTWFERITKKKKYASDKIHEKLGNGGAKISAKTSAGSISFIKA